MKKNKKFITIVDGKFGKYSYRGIGTSDEVQSTTNFLVKQKGIDPSKINIVPVWGPMYDSQRYKFGWRDVIVTISALYALFKLVRLFIKLSKKLRKKK